MEGEGKMNFTGGSEMDTCEPDSGLSSGDAATVCIEGRRSHLSFPKGIRVLLKSPKLHPEENRLSDKADTESCVS
jgi:hypothetical protein